jgi:hypothetical protein
MCNTVDGRSQDQEAGGHNPPAGGLVALAEFDEVLGEVPEAG